jgi:hypothetical protein
MNPLAIIRAAQDDGVVLSVSTSGNLKVLGDQDVVNRWLPALRGHKMGLLRALRSTPAERYYAHHFQCPVCIAAGRNSALSRCAEGTQLWEAHCACVAARRGSARRGGDEHLEHLEHLPGECLLEGKCSSVNASLLARAKEMRRLDMRDVHLRG